MYWKICCEAIHFSLCNFISLPFQWNRKRKQCIRILNNKIIILRPKNIVRKKQVRILVKPGFRQLGMEQNSRWSHKNLARLSKQKNILFTYKNNLDFLQTKQTREKNYFAIRNLLEPRNNFLFLADISGSTCRSAHPPWFNFKIINAWLYQKASPFSAFCVKMV